MNLRLHIIRRKTLPIVWLLLGLFTIYPAVQHAWSDIVLCIGTDGHVKFENGTERDCAPHLAERVSENHYEHVLPVIGPEISCDLCRDIALRTSPFDGQRATSKKAHVSLDILPKKAKLLLAHDHNRDLHLNSRSPETTPLPFFAPLHTVALLI